MEYTPTTHKFVVVLNRKIPVPNLMNAIGHMTAGLISTYGNNLDFMRFQVYTDKTGTTHGDISDNPYIVLKADNSNQLRTLRNNLIEKEIKFTDFTSAMVVGTYADQHKLMNETAELDLEYYGVCFFTTNEQARELTKKFSLFV